MNIHQQRLDLDAPQPAIRPVRAQVREVPAGDARPAPAAARELWAAVQLGGRQGEFAVEGDAISAAQAVLIRRAQSLTPRVTVESTDAVLLELAGSQNLFGGLPGLLAELRKAFPRPLQLALAPTPLAAVLLARAGRNCCINTTARLAGRIAPLPLRHLHWPEDELQRLASMGVNTVGELLRLPRAGLARRIGPERLWQLDRLTGARADPRRLLLPTPRFSQRIEPDFETTDRERLLAALQPALRQLEEFLRERQRGVMALRLVLQHRRAADSICLLRCVVPEYRAARFAALLTARLETLQLAEPVRGMELIAGRPRRFLADSGALWAPGEQGGAAPAAQAPEFLQTLLARLGERAAHGLAQVDEHRPERQYRHMPPALSEAARSEAIRVEARGLAHGMGHAAASAGAARPLGLMREPVPLDALCDAAGRVRRLQHEGCDLALVSGPERIESGWWDGADVARDYYVATTADGARWWIYRECAAPRRWFLHGCFA
ncbi:MAG: DNA polymerase Y family protein [Proteobacteria bacterium]|nr:DNA polymerase Y family protein [Pseudomonadota bacterium]